MGNNITKINDTRAYNVFFQSSWKFMECHDVLSGYITYISNLLIDDNNM